MILFTHLNETWSFPTLLLNFWHANHASRFHFVSVAHLDQGSMKHEVDGGSKSRACTAFTSDRADALYWRKRDDLLKSLESFHVQIESGDGEWCFKWSIQRIKIIESPVTGGARKGTMFNWLYRIYSLEIVSKGFGKCLVIKSIDHAVMLKTLCKAQYLFFKLLKLFDEFSRKFYCTQDSEQETLVFFSFHRWRKLFRFQNIWVAQNIKKEKLVSEHRFISVKQTNVLCKLAKTNLNCANSNRVKVLITCVNTF